MLLEERIKQSKPFRSQAERLVVNIMYSAAWLQEHLREFLADFDITQQQYNVLRILRGQHPQLISTSDIRDRMVDRAPDTSRIVDRLVAKGVVDKSPCSSDKRRVDVCINKKGLDLLANIDLKNSLIDSITKGLNEDDCVELNRLLDRMKDIDNQD